MASQNATHQVKKRAGDKDGKKDMASKAAQMHEFAHPFSEDNYRRGIQEDYTGPGRVVDANRTERERLS